MIRRPPRSTLDRSSAASDVYKRQVQMRKRGFTYVEIAETVGVSKATVSNWLKDEVWSQEIYKTHKRRAAKENSKRIRTVSYTHLRAHETVLDLVCRLLLEKKKKANKKKQKQTKQKKTKTRADCITIRNTS